MNAQIKRFAAAILIAVSFAAVIPVSYAQPKVNTSAKAMALIDCETGKVLSEENGDLKLPMASTTKIMTALIVLENCDINEEFEIPREAVGVEGSSICLEEDEKMTVIDLLYGLMLASGNDAAVALAVHTSGSVSAFVDLMNERAANLGLKSTHFITPNGLHDEKHLTTAYELCLITREALKNEVFARIVSTKYYTAGSGAKQRTFKNKNSLLWNYEGAFGVKTGYTMAAGRCLVFGAERDGMRIVGAVLNCRPMFETAERLLDQAFSDWVRMTVVEEGATVLKTFVQNSGGSILEVETKDSIIEVMKKSEEASFRLEPVLSGNISAPVAKGETVGYLRVFRDDEIVGVADLIAADDVLPSGFKYWWDMLIGLFVSNH